MGCESLKLFKDAKKDLAVFGRLSLDTEPHY